MRSDIMNSKKNRKPYSANRWNSDAGAYTVPNSWRPLTEEEKESLKKDEKEFNEMLERAKKRRKDSTTCR